MADASRAGDREIIMTRVFDAPRELVDQLEEYLARA